MRSVCWSHDSASGLASDGTALPGAVQAGLWALRMLFSSSLFYVQKTCRSSPVLGIDEESWNR